MEQAKNKNKDNVDFEIRFFEGVIRNRPSFIEALVSLGDLYTKRGLYRKGLNIDERLTQLRPDDPVMLYNLACSYSLLEDIDKAVIAIKKAIICGYSDFEHLNQDSDLENLRQDNRFQEFYAQIKRNST